jgi:peptide/nickel transport system permease protein
VSLGLAYAVLEESALSFLGLGAQSPQPAWGAMLATARPYLTENPWYAFFPAAAVFLLGLIAFVFSDNYRR